MTPRIAAAAGALAAATMLTAPAQAAPAPKTVEAIVQFAPGTSNTTQAALVRAAGGRITGDLHLIGGVAARVPAGALRALEAEPAVANVSRNAAVESTGVAPSASKLATAYPFALRATDTWSASTGDGVTVAVIDSGVAGDLPDFKGADGRSRVVQSVVVNPNATSAKDGFGHGTHVAGIIAGNSYRRASNDPGYGKYVGVAPDARVVAVKVADDAGEATVLDVIYGLQFAVDRKDDYGIRVVNLSVQSAQAESAKTDPLDAAVESAWLKGLVVVAAAGNRGADADAVHYAPANDPYAITVGAIDDKGTRNLSDDVLAGWSGRGVTQDGHKKPDIAAPGANIVSTLAPGSTFAAECPSCIVDRAYIRAGGTSMAAPMVTGVVALMLEEHPEWTPDQVKGALMATGRAIPGGVPIAEALAASSLSTPPSGTNAGLVPNTLIDRTTGLVDYTKSTWSKSTWSTAPTSLTASYAQSSLTCDCSLTSTGAIDPTRSTWSRSTWSVFRKK